MRAVTIVNESVVLTEKEMPSPTAGELLIRVASAGVNRADIMQMEGHYPAPPGVPADVPGLELLGTVEAVGPAVRRFRVGDQVMALLAGGAQAEYAVVDQDLALACPRPLGPEAAGAFMEVFTTAYDALFSQCALRMDERVLINGAAGGVGMAAVQLAVAIGAHVTASVRSPDHRKAVAALGAEVVAPEDCPFDKEHFDVVLELVGASNFENDLRALANRGRIAVIGIGSGYRSTIDLRTLLYKRARILGSTLRARTLAERALAVRAVQRHVLPLVHQGRLQVPIAQAFALTDAPSAYGRFIAGNKFGKIVLLNDAL